MRVVAEPLITREAVLAVLKPGELTTERPFRTLRQRNAASTGLDVRIRTVGGRVLGRIQLYSNLNADAARWYRLQEFDIARELAARAQELEASDAAEALRAAVLAAAARMPIDPLTPESPAALRRYVVARRRFTWRGLDVDASAREWLACSQAWLARATADRDALIEAIVELDRAASEVRADVLPPETSLTTFFGIVQRLDATAAEVEGLHDALLVPREDLERQGLAAVGQAVALLQEVLPSGGSYSFPMSAVALDDPPAEAASDPWDTDFLEDGAMRAVVLKERDAAWLDRALAREPTAVPAGPLRLA